MKKKLKVRVVWPLAKRMSARCANQRFKGDAFFSAAVV